MRHDDRQGIRMTRAHVDKVNVQAVDVRYELRQGIELRFHLAPVVVRAPIANELLQLLQLDALRSIRDSLAVGPTGGGDAPAEIIQLGLGDLDSVGAYRAIFGPLQGRGRLSLASRGEHE